MKKIFFFLCILFYSVGCFSQSKDWIFIGKSKDTLSYFIKTEITNKGEYDRRSNVISVWTKRLKYRNPKDESQGIEIIRRSLMHFDLDKQQYQVGTTVETNSIGEITSSYKYDESDGAWQDIVPETIADYTLQKAQALSKK